MLKTAQKNRKPREVSIVSGRIRISNEGRKAAEIILLYRQLCGNSIADLTTGQIVDEALEFHAASLAQRCGPVPKLRATA